MRSVLLLLVNCLLASGQGVWEAKAPLPIAATEVSAAALNGKIYLTCGLTAGGNSRALYIYDPRNDTWSRGADNPLQGGGDHCNVAAASGKLYLLGAIRIGSSFVDGNTYEYDPAADTWQTVGQMGAARGASGVAAIGNRIYVAGGLDGRGSVASFEAFDVSARSWVRLPDMPTARDHLTAQAVNDRFYAIAGRSNRDLTANEEFNPATNQWSARAPVPTARGGLASGVLDNRILAVGGEGNSGTPEATFQQNEEYNPATDTWRALPPVPTPRHGLYGAVVEGRLFLPSGGPRAGATFSATHEAYYPAPSTAPSVAPDSIRNAASFSTALAPGMLVSIFGRGLASGEQAAGPPLPFFNRTGLNAVSVLVNDLPATMLYTSPGQVNVALPVDLPAGTAQVRLTNAGVATAPVTVNVAQTAIGLFSLDGSGSGQGAILIAGTGLIARATRDAFSRAARRGVDAIEIYCTGVGRLETRVMAPVITVGGVAAELLYIGGVGSGFGNQVDVRVPAQAPTGTAIPVQITFGGFTSNTVTMAVVE